MARCGRSKKKSRNKVVYVGAPPKRVQEDARWLRARFAKLGYLLKGSGSSTRAQLTRLMKHKYPELSRSPLPPRRVRRRGGRALGDGSRILPPHARARAGGECASCAPPRCAKRMGSAMERAAQGALAASLLELPGEAHVSAAGPEPALHELPAHARWLEGPAVSRIPHRG